LAAFCTVCVHCAASSAGLERAARNWQRLAATQVWAATSPDAAAHNGGYLADCGPTVPGPAERDHEPWIADAATAGRLWELSEQLVGLTFDQS